MGFKKHLASEHYGVLKWEWMDINIFINCSPPILNLNQCFSSYRQKPSHKILDHRSGNLHHKTNSVDYDSI